MIVNAMATFYPPIDFDQPQDKKAPGSHAERRVLEALEELDNSWRIFHHFQWRDLDRGGERIGETDLILFHPDLGLLIIEVKGGGIRIENGEWYYMSLFDHSLTKMKNSPLWQARRNRYFLEDKLGSTTLGNDIIPYTAITHTAWFPDITWQGEAPSELPGSSFILDSRHLKDPEKHIRRILTTAKPAFRKWSRNQTGLLLHTLAPEVNLIPQLGFALDTLRDKLFRMTQGQTEALRALRMQKRLLVEGSAGSGKTLLAIQLAREHIMQGRKVFFTCYNKNIAEHIATDLGSSSSAVVLHYHELVRNLCEQYSIPYVVPDEEDMRNHFFESECAELLLKASAFINEKFDTIIVDEALDFKDTWWISLESLGKKDFSYYVFYDRNQNVFTDRDAWSPPFEAEPVLLDRNVRNTKQVWEFANKLGDIQSPQANSDIEGPDPVVKTYTEVPEIPVILKEILKDLKKQGVSPDEIVVLAPYRHDNERLGLGETLKDQPDVFTSFKGGHEQGKIRVGTIQAFKGLEADVVILCGIDGHMPACKPANLYVGATRARSLLYVIHHKDFNLFPRRSDMLF